MADVPNNGIGLLGGGPSGSPGPDGTPPGGTGFSFTGLINVLSTIARNLAGIQTAITNSFTSLSGTNVFTGLNTFTIPIVVNAGSVGTGTIHPEGVISIQCPPGGVGNGADATEDTLFTYSLPANSFDANGRGVRITAWGTLAANGNNKTTKIYWNTTNLSSGVLTLSGVSWKMQAEVHRSGSNQQVAVMNAQFGGTVINPSVTAPTATDTGAIVIKVTGQSGSSAANDVLAYAMRVEYLN